MRVDPEDLYEALIRATSRGIRVALPVKVLTVDHAAGTVAVRVEIKRPRTDPDLPADEPETIPDVPVLFPSSSVAEVSYQIEPDDRGLILCADYALGRWREAGEVVDPGSGEAHGLSGAVFLPGLWPDGAQVPIPASGLLVGLRGGERLEVVPGEVRAGSGASARGIKESYLVSEDAFLAALDAFLTAQVTFTAALAGLPGMAGPAGTFTTAINVFKTAADNFKSGLAGHKTTVTRVK